MGALQSGVRSNRSSSQNVRIPRATPVERSTLRKPERKENLRKSSAPEPSVAFPAVVGPVDSWLAATVIALIAFGVVMVYSASSVWAHRYFHNDHLFLVRQVRHAAIGMPLMYALARLDYHHLRRVTYPAMAVSLLLLAATALGLGHAAGGAARWIKLGPLGVQPAEVTKLTFICWLAYSLSNKTARIRSFSVGFLPHLLGAAVVMLLCLKQPDFGSAVMIGLILFCLLFTAGARLGYLLAAGLLSLPLIYGAVAGSEYRLRRIMSFLSNSENYQIRESWMSFGAGGLTGVGIGDSHQKLLFLPEAHTDFISAIVGEELGLVGFTIMVLAFSLVVYRGILAALRAVDEYGTYLAVGITLFLGTQAFTNLAVAVGLVPTKGLVLPFISYGGTSLVVNCCCVGILLNVSRARSLTYSSAERASVTPTVFGGVA